MDEQTKRDYYNKLLDQCPTLEIQAAFSKGFSVLGTGYDAIVASISGGSDSDVVMDFIEKLKQALSIKADVKYVFFDTGMEFKATKDHLDFLEKKYGIKIHREKAVKPVPLAVREHGVPFISKQVSKYMHRLQKHGFRWEDEPFDVLLKRYPRCKSALRWWCNEWGEGSAFNISRNKLLKEFIVENPPDFSVSDKCCEYAKKKTAARFQKSINGEAMSLNVQGLRKAEGGIRRTSVSGCFSQNCDGLDVYRPILWFGDTDKSMYCEVFAVQHSRCYSQYGLKRTGCACCPFGKEFEKELEIAQLFEPKLFMAANKVFGASYEYTRAYMQFRKKREAMSTIEEGQLVLF